MLLLWALLYTPGLEDENTLGHPSWLDITGCSLPVCGGDAGQGALHKSNLPVHGPRAQSDTGSPGLSEPSLLGSLICCQLPHTQQLLLPGPYTVH